MIPKNLVNLNKLRAICSTGSPLAPSSYDYIYRDIKSDILLASIAGGTDIIGCFFAATQDFDCYRGKLAPPSLGFDVYALDINGNICPPGVAGDLVCLTPFPSMPRYFINDPDGKRYDKAYFEKYPGIWTHGDFIEFDERGYSMILGRSDATLNPNGVRFGTADLYNVMEEISDIDDSLAVPQRHPVSMEERVIMFVKMKSGKTVDIKTIKTKIRTQLSARHVPAMLLVISDIPYTISGKKVEIAVRDIIHGKKVTYTEAFKNPESLNLYQKLFDDGAFEWS